jgi:hypothetical protein
MPRFFIGNRCGYENFSRKNTHFRTHFVPKWSKTLNIVLKTQEKPPNMAVFSYWWI